MSNAAAQRIDNRIDRQDEQFGRAVAIDRSQFVSGVPFADRVQPGTTNVTATEVGRADAYVLDRILRDGFE